MAGNEELISEYIDRDGVKGDTDFLLDNLNQVNDLLNQIFNTKRSLGKSTTLSDAIQGSQQLASLQQQLNDQNKKTIDIQNQLNAALEKVNQTRSAGKIKTADQISDAILIREINKETTQGLVAQTDAYKALDIAYQKAASNAKTLQAKALQTGNPDDKAAADVASGQANALNSQLKTIDSTVGESRRKIGDYTGALKILEDELARVNQRLAQLTQAGQQGTTEFVDLSNKAGLLGTIVSNTSKGYTSVTQEIRGSERALQTLTAAGYGSGQAFDKLRQSTVAAAQTQKEFQRQQKLLEGEAPLLGGLILAAKGLAGAYAVGAGAVQLFAGENEKAQEHLNKLIAIMSILNGLTEAYNVYQRAGAIVTEFKNAALAAAVVVQNAFKASTVETVVANTALAASEAEVTVATQGEAAALTEVAVAADIEAASMETAAVATAGLGTAFLATGIGVVVAALAVGAIYLISKIKEWTADTELNTKQQKELTDALNEQLATVREINELYSNRPDIKNDISALETQLSLEEKSGQNQFKILATKQLIADKNKQIADYEQANLVADAEQKYVDKGLKGVAALKQAQIDYFETYTEAKYKTAALEDNLAKVKAEPDATRLKQNVEELTNLVDAAKSNEKYAKAKYDLYFETGKRVDDADKAVQENITDRTKLSEDERRKIILESTKLEAALITTKNDIILSDERSSLDQRLKALQSNAAAQRSVLRAELNDVLSRPDARKPDGTLSADAQIAIKKEHEAERALNLKLNEDDRKTNYDFYEREKTDRLAIATEALNEQLKINEEFLNEDKAQKEVTLENFKDYQIKQNEALASSYIVRKAIIQANQIKETTDAAEQGKTNAEKLAIAVKYANQFTDLERFYDKEQTDLKQKQLNNELIAIKKFYEDEKRVIDKAESDRIVHNDNRYIAGKTSNAKRLKDNATAAYNARVAELEAAQRADFKAQEAAPEDSPERKSANEQKAKDDQDLAETNAGRKKTLDDEALKRTKDYLDLGLVATETIKSAVNDRYENELAYIGRLREQNNLLKQEETDRLTTSTLNVLEKAGIQARVDKEAATRAATLDLQERKIRHDQAVANKAFDLAAAIAKGALAVLSAYAEEGPIGAAIAGAVVALEVAKIAATVVPAYKEGTQDHPGGLAVTGDGGLAELIKEPGKPAYWSNPYATVSYLQPHTAVYPMKEVHEMAKNYPFPMPSIDSINHYALENAVNGLREDFQNHTSSIVKAISKQKPVKVIIKEKNSWADRIREQVYS